MSNEGMSDKELLNLAAKATGHSAKYNLAGDCQLFKDDEYVCFWNPLKFDGDALRLAVSLRLAISFNSEMSGPTGMIAIYVRPELLNVGVWIDSCPDSQTATRRAIVLAAAAIGGAMP